MVQVTYSHRFKPPKYGDREGKWAVADTGDPYQNLANAIVHGAADDYRRARRYLIKHPEIPESEYGRYMWADAHRVIVECEAFFCGDWIKMLTALDGVEILNRLRGEYGRKTVSADGEEIS